MVIKLNRVLILSELNSFNLKYIDLFVGDFYSVFSCNGGVVF